MHDAIADDARRRGAPVILAHEDDEYRLDIYEVRA